MALLHKGDKIVQNAIHYKHNKELCTQVTAIKM